MLKYVRIPHIRMYDDTPMSMTGGLRKKPNMPRIVFDFLRERCDKLHTVLEVWVTDASGPGVPGRSMPHWQHTNDTIRYCLEPYKDHLEKLNWQKFDICIDTIHELAPNLQVLYLYSSGNSAVLRYWASTQGLKRFKQVK